jgi:hypothetical protein
MWIVADLERFVITISSTLHRLTVALIPAAGAPDKVEQLMSPAVDREKIHIESEAYGAKVLPANARQPRSFPIRSRSSKERCASAIFESEFAMIPKRS